MTSVAALSVLAVLQVASVHLQPGVARPGDAVLVTVLGVTKQPSGTLGPQTLDFLPVADGYQALVALSVEAQLGPRALTVELVPDGEAETTLSGTLEIVEPGWPRRELKVARKFTSPSKAEQLRSARDTKAFSEAFDVELEPWLFTDDFSWPRPPDITAPFGDLRLINGKKNSQHFGMDLDGDTGDDIVAANAGEVVLVRDCFASGNTVLVHHGGRLFTAYFHLSRFDVKEGDQVKPGQRLGRVGKTGRVTGPHLHFGVKLDGRWVDPASLLRLKFFEATSALPVSPPANGG
ncbi:MAG: M23 family metallopeptidase [Myxococcaceae bacterium]|nr:M23 family metallopeptidase [Myxococcaceae bacterium]